MSRVSRSAGFTLIEVLVALAVFAILSALAYGGLSQTLTSAEILSDRMDRLQGLQRAVRMLSDDLQQLTPRPVRDELGDGLTPALNTSFQSGFAIELTHAGWSNPVRLPRSTLQRTAYRIEDGELVRYYWPILDRTLGIEPVGVVLLDDVDGLQFRFMQTNGDWIDQWPASNRVGVVGARERPRAVEIILTLADIGEVTRLIEIAP